VRSSRPRRLVGVAGTGTDVGKTWVTAAVARALRAGGVSVAARKPAQSFGPDDVLDAVVLGDATGEAPEVVCRPDRWYEVPMAPPMAASALGRPSFTIADLAGELKWPDGVEVGFLETAGGVRSPIADDGDCAALLRAVAPDIVILVADAGLGTINAVRLSLDALSGFRTLVVLNRYDDSDNLHRANRVWLVQRACLDVATTIEALARGLL